MPGESVLLIEVPEAETLVGALRTLHDPAASRGVPAHVTVLFPFKAPDQITEADLHTLADVFASAAPFEFRFDRIGRFPGVLYLAPEPAEAFKALTYAVVARFPACPPYGGVFGDEPTPHLTVAQSEDPATYAAIETGFRAVCAAVLPIRSRATAVLLMECRGDRYQTRRRFALGAA